MSTLTVPDDLAARIGGTGGEGARWIARLPDLVTATCRRWELQVDGEPAPGRASLVVPVRRPVGARAVLKVAWPPTGTAPEAAALRAWAGGGAVHLLDHDPEAGALLLERLDAEHDLGSLADAEAACDLAALLFPVLHATDPPEAVPSVADLARDWEEWMLARWETAHAPFPRRRAEEARELAAVLPPEGPVRLLHGNLHLAHVLADPEERGRTAAADALAAPGAVGGRGWLAIGPEPVAGDPAAEGLALLRSRSDVWAGASDPPAAIRGRLARICDTGGLDPDRARAWALLRSVVAQTAAVLDGQPAEAAVLDTIGAALAASRAF